MNTPIEALDLAAQLCGSQARLAALITAAAKATNPAARYTQSHVSKWKKIGKVQAEACPLIESVTHRLGCRVPSEQLRPDVAWSVLRTRPPRR